MKPQRAWSFTTDPLLPRSDLPRSDLPRSLARESIQLAPNPPPPLPFLFLSSHSRRRPFSSSSRRGPCPAKPPRPLPSQIRRGCIPFDLGRGKMSRKGEMPGGGPAPRGGGPAPRSGGGGTEKGRGGGTEKGRGGGLVKARGAGTTTGGGGGDTSPPAVSGSPAFAAPPPAAASPAAPPPLWPGYAGSPAPPPNSSPHGTQCTNPWGSYLNMLKQPYFPPLQPFGDNSHHVGGTNTFQPPSPAPEPYPNERATIDLDEEDGVEASRSAKRRYWSHEEEVKLASAWLNTSKDPIHGNEKKSDSFWSQITKEFNQDKQREYHRDTNCLKIHWTRLSKMINEFNGYWISVCKMNKSGYSDDQLMDEAQKRYEKKNEKSFTLIHWWRILKDEPKWCTFAAQSEKDKSKKGSQATGGDNTAEQRPIGRESAKQERKGKRNVDQVMDGIEILGENVKKKLLKLRKSVRSVNKRQRHNLRSLG